ncbi:hypothetical protein D3C84_786000 [compost metagenome]
MHVVCIQPAHIDNVRYVQHDDRLFKIRRHLLQHRQLIRRQQIASRLIRVVLVFPCCTAEDNNGFARPASRRRYKLSRERHFLLMPRLGSPAASSVIERILLDPLLVYRSQLFVQLDARLAPKTAKQIRRMRNVDAAA